MWPFNGMRRVKCPGGHEVFVYRDANKAIPLALKDATRNFDAGGAIGDLGEANLGADFSSSFKNLLFSINKQNSSQILDFRMIYTAYQHDPCRNADLYNRELLKIIETRNRLSVLELQTAALIELIRSNKISKESAAEQISKIGIELGSPLPEISAALIEESTNDASEIIEGS